MRKTRIILLAAILLFATIAAACATSDVPGKDTTVSGNEAETEGKTVYRAEIPAGTDFGGSEFRIAVNDSTQYWADINFTYEDQNGSYINDSVLYRARAVEEALGLKLVAVPFGNVAVEMSKIIGSSDPSIDMCWIAPVGANGLIVDNGFIELGGVGSLDLDNPWWDSDAAKDLSVCGRLYMAYGDISMMYKRTMSVCLFNKTMLADYKAATSPYGYMESDSWTYDAMFGLAQLVSQDVDNDGLYSLENDVLGLAHTPDQLPIMMLAGGVRFTEKDADDEPELVFYNDNTANLYDKLVDYMYDESLVICTDSSASTRAFNTRHSLFCLTEMHAIPGMRNMEDDFGIAPFPKYNEEQERYYHVINPNVACAMLIPASVSDPEKTGLVAEVLGAEGKNFITPAYYDVTLTTRDTRDDESVESLDIIFSTTTYDPAHIYDWGGIGSTCRGLASKKAYDLASEYAAIETRVKTAIERAVSQYSDLD